MKSRPTPHAGFTLVELLVVIGIIAMLISILLPTLSRAREMGNRIKCAANMRQWYSAVMLYVNDKKCLPGPLIMPTVAPEKLAKITKSTILWRPGFGLTDQPANATRFRQTTADPEMLGRYLGNKPTTTFNPLYQCPSNVNMYESAYPVDSGSAYQGLVLGYAYRFNNQPDTDVPFFFGYWGTNSTYLAYPRGGLPKRITEVRGAYSDAIVRPANIKITPNYDKDGAKVAFSRRTPSNVWFMSDLDGRNFSTATSDIFGIEVGSIDEPLAKFQPPHKSGVVGRNYIYFDGHTEWRRWDDVEPVNVFW